MQRDNLDIQHHQLQCKYWGHYQFDVAEAPNCMNCIFEEALRANL